MEEHKIKIDENNRAYIDRYRIRNNKLKKLKRYGIISNCKDCNKTIFIRDDVIKNPNVKILCKDCLSKGKNSGSWKGGSYIDKDGYKVVNVDNHQSARKCGYILKHRLIIEKQIGRYLHRWEVVHHINGIRADNHLENLMLCKNQSEHRKIHVNMKRGSQ